MPQQAATRQGASQASLRDTAKVIAELRPGFRACYDRALTQNASIEGCVRLAIRVREDGSVSSVAAASALPVGLIDCLRAHATGARFSPPAGGKGVIVVPIALTPRENAARSMCGGSVVQSAADLTNQGRALIQRAAASDDELEQRALVGQAVDIYDSAAVAWAASNSWPSRADAQFWEADARFWVVVLRVELGETPSAREIEAAFSSARAVRNGLPSFATVAAWYLVDLCDALVRADGLRHARTAGREGVAEQPEVDLTSPAPLPQPVKPSPAAEAALQARSEFLARPVDPRFAKNRPRGALEGARLLLAHGQLSEALRWLEIAEREGCAHDRAIAEAASLMRTQLARRLANAQGSTKSGRRTPCR